MPYGDHRTELRASNHHNNLDFATSDLFASKFDTSTTRPIDMDFYSFDQAMNAGHSGSADMSGYDLPVSPTMSQTDMFFSNNTDNSGEARPMHIDPTATWNGSAKNNMSNNVDIAATQTLPGLNRILTDYEGPTSRLFGQITPPSENDTEGDGKATVERADSGVGGKIGDIRPTNVPTQDSSHSQSSRHRTLSTDDRPTKRAKKEVQVSDDEDDEDATHKWQPGGKREKYREKNRVAAAKCRAKKKEHVDHLEETHRTQSVLNVALKQTEKSLRDELSFWRTQALQHTFCQCHSIQEYNMRKARNLAAESMLGNPLSNRSPSLNSIGSGPAMSPTMAQPGHYYGRSQSIAGMEGRVNSPVMASTSRKSRPKSFAAPLAAAAQSSVGSQHVQRTPESRLQTPAISGIAERDLKDFVGEVAD